MFDNVYCDSPSSPPSIDVKLSYRTMIVYEYWLLSKWYS